jgi:hypothetical protein
MKKEKQNQTVYYTSTMPILIRRGQLMMLIWILGPKNIGENPKPATTLNQTPLFSKYNSGFTYVAPAPKKELQKPTVEFLKDSIE